MTGCGTTTDANGIGDELPFPLGHEAAGDVESAGEEVTEVTPVTP